MEFTKEVMLYFFFFKNCLIDYLVYLMEVKPEFVINAGTSVQTKVLNLFPI